MSFISSGHSAFCTDFFVKEGLFNRIIMHRSKSVTQGTNLTPSQPLFGPQRTNLNPVVTLFVWTTKGKFKSKGNSSVWATNDKFKSKDNSCLGHSGEIRTQEQLFCLGHKGQI
ncbi:hypothetical protein CHS0354_020507 [Potamilus streckersoni]|uniref:Uncharacterized protein n=1 Tax=Potamilus streckersoni TaxID=2493646 RepID=A0AAE0W5C3_9BIVA|nr:hypothetical protein CHS0354_020507 [Potamilus streckersoni]